MVLGGLQGFGQNFQDFNIDGLGGDGINIFNFLNNDVMGGGGVGGDGIVNGLIDMEVMFIFGDVENGFLDEGNLFDGNEVGVGLFVVIGSMGIDFGGVLGVMLMLEFNIVGGILFDVLGVLLDFFFDGVLLIYLIVINVDGGEILMVIKEGIDEVIFMVFLDIVLLGVEYIFILFGNLDNDEEVIDDELLVFFQFMVSDSDDDLVVGFFMVIVIDDMLEINEVIVM